MADASSVTAFALTGIVPPVATMAYSDEDIALGPIITVHASKTFPDSSDTDA